MTLPPFAAVLCCGAIAAERRRLLSINIFIPPGSQQQTRRTPLLLTIDGTGGWTDGRTLDHFVDPALHIMSALSIRWGQFHWKSNRKSYVAC